MSTYAFIDPEMNEVMIATQEDFDEEGNIIPVDPTWILVPDDTEPDDIYIDNGEVFDRPAKPSLLSTWNETTNTWETPTEAQANDLFVGGKYRVLDVEFTVNEVDHGVIMNGGVAERTKGLNVERRNVYPADFWHPLDGNPVFFYYDWDTEYIHETLNLMDILSNEKRVIIGEYDGWTFKDYVRNEPIDRDRVVSRSIGANHLVADEAIINTAHIENLAVGRIKIANGAVTEQAVYSVWAPSGFFVCDNATTDLDAYQWFPQYTDIHVGYDENAISRLMLTPEFYGGEYVTVTSPTTAGYRHAKFYVNFKLTAFDYDWQTEVYSNPVVLAERSAKLNQIDWKDGYVTNALGGDPSTALTTDFSINLEEHYNAGQVLRMQLGYYSYSSHPAECKIIRRIPGFGFRWQAFWK